MDAKYRIRQIEPSDVKEVYKLIYNGLYEYIVGCLMEMICANYKIQVRKILLSLYRVLNDFEITEPKHKKSFIFFSIRVIYSICNKFSIYYNIIHFQPNSLINNQFNKIYCLIINHLPRHNFPCHYRSIYDSTIN